MESVQLAWPKTARSVCFVVTNLSVAERGKKRKSVLNEGASVIYWNPPSLQNSLQHKMYVLQLCKKLFQDSQLPLIKKVDEPVYIICSHMYIHRHLFLF